MKLSLCHSPKGHPAGPSPWTCWSASNVQYFFTFSAVTTRHDNVILSHLMWRARTSLYSSFRLFSAVETHRIFRENTVAAVPGECHYRRRPETRPTFCTSAVQICTMEQHFVPNETGTMVSPLLRNHCTPPLTWFRKRYETHLVVPLVPKRNLNFGTGNRVPGYAYRGTQNYPLPRYAYPCVPGSFGYPGMHTRVCIPGYRVVLPH